VKGIELRIGVASGLFVSGLLLLPGSQRFSACYVMAHGAGAGMKHRFMSAVANGLVQRGIATLRYQFPYMEEGSKRPVGLTRFRGHPEAFTRGAPNAENPPSVFA